MAKKQTRRSVSIRGATYELIRQYCEQNGLSMSEFVEERIAEFFGQSTGRKSKSGKKAPSQSRLSPDELQEAARYFTF